MKQPFRFGFIKKKKSTDGSSNKYNNEKVECDGILFDSKVEYRRYLFLKSQQEAGVISDLRTHVTFNLVPKQTRTEHRTKQLKTKLKEWDQEVVVFKKIDFSPDFVYMHNGNLVAEDVKGSKLLVSKDFPLRQKLLYFFHGIYCHIITKPTAPIPQ